jgi:hypothetical protein
MMIFLLKRAANHTVNRSATVLTQLNSRPVEMCCCRTTLGWEMAPTRQDGVYLNLKPPDCGRCRSDNGVNDTRDRLCLDKGGSPEAIALAK